MTRQYVAVLADAARSRHLPPSRRATLQAGLRAAVVESNRRWHSFVAAGFALSRGDELEVLLTNARAVWDISHALRASFPDVDWVLACARGPVTTALAPTALEVDGPCFHAARDALAAAKRARQLFTFRGFDGDATLNGFAAYYSAQYWSWTERQRRLALALRAAGPLLAGAARPPERRREASAESHMRRRMAWPLVEAGDTIFRTLLERA